MAETIVESATKNSCLQQSLAHYLSVPLSDVPKFHKMKFVGSEWRDAVTSWANSLGYDITLHHKPEPGKKYVAVGKVDDINHCIVVNNGEMIFDANKDKKGLDSTRYYFKLDEIPSPPDDYSCYNIAIDFN